MHDGVVITWRQFDRHADALAATLLERGCVEQDKVAQYLYNGPEYLETVFAAFKAGLAVVNTNYRYTADELTYLWDNGDVVAVVFHGAFAPQCEEVRRRLPRISTWLWVDDGTAPAPTGPSTTPTPYLAAKPSSACRSCKWTSSMKKCWTDYHGVSSTAMTIRWE